MKTVKNTKNFTPVQSQMYFFLRIKLCKGVSIKKFCVSGFQPLMGWEGLSEFVKKVKFVKKIFFSDNVE